MPLPSKRIALCLSGGGLRATFYHLGTVQALRRLGLLGDVKEIISVSGGSILAAHLLLNWSRYSGDDDKAFEAAKAEVLALGRRDIRGRVLRRWFLATPLRLTLGHFTKFRFRSTEYLQSEYRRFYKDKLFADAALEQPDAPDIHILATNLVTGQLCSFSKTGYYVEGEDEPLFECQAIPLALAVAASSAFPPMFPPVHLSRDQISATVERFPASAHLLTDGGIFDNTGIEKAALLKAREKLQADIIISSDAGAPFDWSEGSTYGGMLPRNIRASELLMNRAAIGTYEKTATPTLVDRVVRCAITATSAAGTLLIDVQKKLPFIRTDLDRFSDLEMSSLIAHGERIALDELHERKIGAVAPPPATALDPSATDISALLGHLDLSRHRSKNPFNWQDPTSVVLGLVPAIILACLVSWVVLPWLAGTTVKQINAAASEATALQNRLLEQEEKFRRQSLEQPTGGGSLPTIPSLGPAPVRPMPMPTTVPKSAFQTPGSLNRSVLARRSVPSGPNIFGIPSSMHEPSPPMIAAATAAGSLPCRHPSHGVESYLREEDVTQWSGWRAGGYSQPSWCNELIILLRASNPKAAFAIVASRERSESHCKPFNCPKYEYSCTVRLKLDPVYKLQPSGLCPP